MTTDKKGTATAIKSRVNIGKLRVNKETVEDLTDKEAEQIKGGGVLDTARTEIIEATGNALTAATRNG